VCLNKYCTPGQRFLHMAKSVLSDKLDQYYGQLSIRICSA
jgi:hypothetical protein